MPYRIHGRAKYQVFEEPVAVGAPHQQVGFAGPDELGDGAARVA